MLTDRDLQELLSYKTEAQVLSIYLDTDPSEGNVDVHKLRLRSMLKDVDLPQDVEAVTRYLDLEHEWSGRSVVLIDKQEARFFYFHLGELREEEEVVGESVRRIKRGGGSQAAGRRGGVAGQTDYVEELAERNIKEAAEYASQFFKENNVRRILIGGTEDNVALFRSQLPKAWQSLVVGTFPISMHATHDEVLEKAMQIKVGDDFNIGADLFVAPAPEIGADMESAPTEGNLPGEVIPGAI